MNIRRFPHSGPNLEQLYTIQECKKEYCDSCFGAIGRGPKDLMENMAHGKVTANTKAVISSHRKYETEKVYLKRQKNKKYCGAMTTNTSRKPQFVMPR